MLSVSVIIPVFNDASGIRTALKGLVQQSFPKDRYEIIVVDNNSTDGTCDAVDAFMRRSNHAIILTRERKQGSYASRNQGIRVAKGGILAFTDADCVPRHDWLEKGIGALFDFEVPMVGGWIDMTFEGTHPNVWEYFDAARKLKQEEYVKKVGFGATANLFVKKGVFDEYGNFRDDLTSGGDYEFGRRLTKAGECLAYAENAVVYHPARRSFRAILKKSKRVAEGQKQLERLKILEHGRISLRTLIPVKEGPALDGVVSNRAQRMRMILLANLMKYFNLICRI